jgi:hypothetical protein
MTKGAPGGSVLEVMDHALSLSGTRGPEEDKSR